MTQTQTATGPRTLVVDDHDMVRNTLVLALQATLRIVGDARDHRSALAEAASGQPELVLLDLALPRPEDGLATLRALRRACPGVRILVMSSHDEPALVGEALDAGADGYFLKEQDFRELCCAIQTIWQGDRYVAPRLEVAPVVRPSLGTVDAGDPLSALSEREREVFRLLARALPNEAIADALGMSLATAETHRWRIMRKLGTKNLGELVMLATRINRRTRPH